MHLNVIMVYLVILLTTIVLLKHSSCIILLWTIHAVSSISLPTEFSEEFKPLFERHTKQVGSLGMTISQPWVEDFSVEYESQSEWSIDSCLTIDFPSHCSRTLSDTTLLAYLQQLYSKLYLVPESAIVIN